MALLQKFSCMGLSDSDPRLRWMKKHTEWIRRNVVYIPDEDYMVWKLDEEKEDWEKMHERWLDEGLGLRIGPNLFRHLLHDLETGFEFVPGVENRTDLETLARAAVNRTNRNLEADSAATSRMYEFVRIEYAKKLAGIVGTEYLVTITVRVGPSGDTIVIRRFFAWVSPYGEESSVECLFDPFKEVENGMSDDDVFLNFTM